MTVRRRRPPILETALTVMGLLLAFGLYRQSKSDDTQLEESKRRGSAVVEALETFRRERGGYPTSLTELVPQHLQTIEPPTWGTGEWRYRSFDQRISADSIARYFELAVAKDETNYPLLYYDWGHRRWVLHN